MSKLSHLCLKAVIFLPAHHASLTHNFSLGCEVFISANPRMQLYCKLVMKTVFWTHKFAVRHIDMGNMIESQDP